MAATAPVAMYGIASSLRGCAKRRTSSTSDTGDQLGDPGPQRRFRQIGMQFPQGSLFERSGQGEQLIGKLKLALGAHCPEPPGLQIPNDRVDVLHGLNLGLPIGVNKSGAAREPDG